MTKIILDEAKVEVAVGEVKPARMTQHVRPHRCEPGALRRDREENCLSKGLAEDYS